MKRFLVLAMLFSSTAFAGEYKLLNLEYYDITYQKFKDNRDPYVPERDDWANRASTNFRIGVLNTLYWDNNVHTETVSSGTVKTVGWHWIIGLRLNEYMDLFQEHHSRHIMEESRPSNNGHNVFPVEDSYGIKIRLIDDKNTHTIGDLFFK